MSAQTEISEEPNRDPKGPTGEKFAIGTIYNGPKLLATVIIGLTLMTILATALTLSVGRYFGKQGDKRAAEHERQIQSDLRIRAQDKLK